MKKIILPNNEQYFYKEYPIYLGDRKLNKEVAKKNLLELKVFLEERDILFFLFYGTLLGVIRENDLISHDQDIDIVILDENKLDFFKNLKELRKIGFEVARYDERGALSLIKNDEYIDICFFKQDKVNTGLRVCCSEYLPDIYFKEIKKIIFLGTEFNIPAKYESFFLFEYGKNWKIPIEYKYSKIIKIKNYVLVLLKNILPAFIKKIYYKRKERKGITNYKRKLKRYQVIQDENIECM